MKLTKEEAIKLHIEMWTAMKEALGDHADSMSRRRFKSEWCKTHFPDENIVADCFLCEYVERNFDDDDNGCEHCPVDWGSNEYGSFDCTTGKNHHLIAPISQILALPIREATK